MLHLVLKRGTMELPVQTSFSGETCLSGKLHNRTTGIDLLGNFTASFRLLFITEVLTDILQTQMSSLINS